MKKKSMDELNRLSMGDFKSKPKIAITIILDDVRSLQNVGSIFRTADAFAVEKICLCGITGTPPQREIERTALGATQSVRWNYFPQLEDALRDCQNQGHEIWAIEQLDISMNLNDFLPEPQKHYALIFGNEVEGVSVKSFPFIKGGIEIPQFGTKHSFNIAVSVGILLWDLSSKLKSF